MKDQYIFASTRARLFEKNLLTQDQWKRLLQASDYDEALTILQETRYGEEIAKLSQKEDYEQLLSNELIKQAGNISELVRDDVLSSLLYLKYEYHNLKVAIQSDWEEEGFLDLEVPIPGIVERSEMKKKAYREGREEYEKNRNGQRLDELLDRYQYLELLEVTKPLKSDFFTEYRERSADFTNLLTYLRIQMRDEPRALFNSYFVAGGTLSEDFFYAHWEKEMKEIAASIRDSGASGVLKDAFERYLEHGDVSLLERHKDEALYAMAPVADQITYGPEILFGYFLKVEQEIQNLRILLAGKFVGLPAEAIEERIRVWKK